MDPMDPSGSKYLPWFPDMTDTQSQSLVRLARAGEDIKSPSQPALGAVIPVPSTESTATVADTLPHFWSAQRCKLSCHAAADAGRCCGATLELNAALVRSELQIAGKIIGRQARRSAQARLLEWATPKLQQAQHRRDPSSVATFTNTGAGGKRFLG